MTNVAHPLSQWLAATNLARRIDARRRWTHNALAPKLRAHPSHITYWFKRRRPMPVAYARRVETLTGGAVTYARICAWEEGR